MLKKFFVLILAVIQILFCISLTAIEPTKEWLIENKGTVYHLKVNSVTFNIYSDSGINFYSCIECDWSNIYDDVYYQVLKSEYAIIETDANGNPKKLENGSYIYMDTNNSTDDFERGLTPEQKMRRNGANVPSWNTWYN